MKCDKEVQEEHHRGGCGGGAMLVGGLGEGRGHSRPKLGKEGNNSGGDVFPFWVIVVGRE